ncbi:MAG: prolipoprotein diacylglyceryl transferase [Synechococcus sp. SB0673_bin_10]|nr:prolipoprotein diacylglyceryl transferase [Cyanobacteria bacterium MAG IRC3_bin_20]MDE0648341.1 prolipoprotein diacylglyceryl transferase [Cyanobacteria bacterium MAG IRC4_bin_6]MXX09243.1 prolipoprotein diacylglyceryl transferase [Synechococcus sp. SB0667_bin_8]MYI71370.1 prolipoprotein diacylglyceryl transferase [Synechococcus sp. SB0673_bin_10]
MGPPDVLGLVFQSPGPMIPHTPLRWYGVLIALAVVIGLTISTRLARWRGLDPLLISDLLPVLAIAAVVAARIYYVAFEWERYHGAWTPLFGIIPIPRAFAVWEGGIAIHGAMVGGLLAVWVFSRLRRQPFWDLLDVLAPSLALGQAIGRWGNFFNSEAFGLPVPADFPVSVRIPPSLVDPQVLLSSPGASHFHATFFYESLWNLAVFGVLMGLLLRCRRGGLKLPAGALTCIYAIAYSLGRFWIEGLRTDPLCLFSSPPFCEGGLRIAQMVSLVMVVLGSLGLAWLYGLRRPLPGSSGPTS